MKRIRIFKAFFVLWLFVYFIGFANKETFVEFFMSTLTFNIVIVTLLGIGTFMLLSAAKDISMIAGTFGSLMYKKNNLEFYVKDLEKIIPSTIANKIKSRVKHNKLIFTQQENEDLLAWMDDKFTNQNKYNSFFIGTVLMIGLLGTFSGLLGAIGSMSGLVSSLAGGDVDIGKVMAGFSAPLSSMAVGFGSSLFGVIASIILSIKGYILNKNQASVIVSVENWLNSKTLDSVDDNSSTIVPSNTLENHQKSFADIFIESIDAMTTKMDIVSKSNISLQESIASEFSKSNKELQRVLTNILHITNKNQNEKFDLIQETQHGIYQILEQFSNNSIQVTNAIKELTIEQNKQNDTLIEITNSLKSTSSTLQSNEIVLRDIKTDNKLDMFQMAESLTALNNSIKAIDDNQLKNKIDNNITNRQSKNNDMDFLEKHFNINKIDKADA